MSDAIVLDATPLGMLCHPRNPPHAAACRQWLGRLVAAGRHVIVPEIASNMPAVPRFSRLLVLRMGQVFDAFNALRIQSRICPGRSRARGPLCPAAWIDIPELPFQ
jgi:hypothetical protein